MRGFRHGEIIDEAGWAARIVNRRRRYRGRDYKSVDDARIVMHERDDLCLAEQVLEKWLLFGPRVVGRMPKDRLIGFIFGTLLGCQFDHPRYVICGSDSNRFAHIA